MSISSPRKIIDESVPPAWEFTRIMPSLTYMRSTEPSTVDDISMTTCADTVELREMNNNANTAEHSVLAKNTLLWARV